MTINIDKKNLINIVTDIWIERWNKLPTNPNDFGMIINEYYDQYGKFVGWDGDDDWNNPHLPLPVAEKLSRDIFDEAVEVINSKLNARREKRRREAARREYQEQQKRIKAAENTVESKARKDKNKASLEQFKKLKVFNNFPNEAIQKYYDDYVSMWNSNHPKPLPAIPRDRPFKEKLNEYVITHPDELLTFEDFKQVIKDWNRNISLNEAYELYKKKFFEIPGAAIHVNEPVNPSKLGFKNKLKYRFIGTSGRKIPDTIVNSFPLKDNLKRYKLHKVTPKGTYMIDFMFGPNSLTYLVAINVNTRYGCIEVTNTEGDDGAMLKGNAKATTAYIRTLNKIMKEVSNDNPIKHLTGDGESAFVSKTTKKFYTENGITFHPVPRMKIEDTKSSEPLHSALGVIDRFIRTIRDMIYQAGYQLTPLAVKEMVRQYNNAPHATLSKLIGFYVSPLMVQKDKNKEEYIVLQMLKHNALVKSQIGFELNNGMRVKVYNEKNKLGKRRRICNPGEIIEKRNGLYKVKITFPDGSQVTQLVPRYKLSI